MKSKAGPVRAYCFYLLITAFFLASLLSLSPVIPTDNRAQAAAPITPSGLNTHVSGPIVSGSGPTQATEYDIAGGTRPGGGVNIFHGLVSWRPDEQYRQLRRWGMVGSLMAIPSLPVCKPPTFLLASQETSSRTSPGPFKPRVLGMRISS